MAEPGAEKRTSGYKSWKKKYRKMRIVFEHKMLECEELHKTEARAGTTVKRLAIENDRLLDLLLDVNNCPQIPPERRINLSLRPPSDAKSLSLPIDRDARSPPPCLKRLQQLLDDVPHPTLCSAKESKSPVLTDLLAPDGEAHPTHFLTPDDVDEYIYAIDARGDNNNNNNNNNALRPPATSRPAPNPLLKNPTSVTNWLRKHAPKIFLQDGEHDDEEGGASAPAAASQKKARAGAKEHRKKAKKGREWEEMEEEEAPVRKRKREEDQGYRPRGSSSRPSKKKRRSDADASRKTKKEARDD